MSNKANHEREYYAKDILQPFQADGTVNPKYVEAYGKDPREVHSHRNYPRNVNNKGYSINKEIDEDMRKFEKRKYGI